MKPILEIKNVSKKFRIQHNAQPYLSLRDSISSVFKREKVTTEEFYALKDLNFNVEAGQSIGIIGRNGAGKSTLLKILSKITPPSTGKIISRGNIASLLEVGTGFHPELTGRENIFLNGSILGMKRKEIQTKFDEIVDFSGTEKFLDTPLKHYSSGMQLRLAFSVAAFLETEIMIIDEVLAVGDTKFQKKCLGKMDDVSRSGRTILFVSHDLDIVKSLCSNVILLQDGEIRKRGDAESVIAEYLSTGGSKMTSWANKKTLKNPHFTKVDISIKGNQPNLKLIVCFSVKCTNDMAASFVSFDIISKTGTALGQAIPNLEPFIQPGDGQQQYFAEIDLPGLVPGDYYLSPWIGPYFSETYDWQKECVEFTVVDTPQIGRVHPHASHTGFLVPNSRLIEA
jgi:lipopolysaccharide transport system ATP-binding protein